MRTIPATAVSVARLLASLLIVAGDLPGARASSRVSQTIHLSTTEALTLRLTSRRDALNRTASLSAIPVGDLYRALIRSQAWMFLGAGGLGGGLVSAPEGKDALLRRVHRHLSAGGLLLIDHPRFGKGQAVAPSPRNPEHFVFRFPEAPVSERERVLALPMVAPHLRFSKTPLPPAVARHSPDPVAASKSRQTPSEKADPTMPSVAKTVQPKRAALSAREIPSDRAKSKETPTPSSVPRSEMMIERSAQVFDDLDRLVALLTTPGLSPDAQEWLIRALQRPWHGIDRFRRAALVKRLLDAGASGPLSHGRAIAAARPIQSALTEAEAAWMNAPQSALFWNGSKSRPFIAARMRVAVQEWAQSHGDVWVSMEKVAARLGTTPDRLGAFFRRANWNPVLFGISPTLLCDELLEAAVMALRRDPVAPVYLDDVMRVLRRTRETLVTFAKDHYGGLGTRVLWERFRIAERAYLRPSEAEGIPLSDNAAPVLEAGLRDYLAEMGVSWPIDFTRPPSDAERKAVLPLLQALATAKRKPIEELSSVHYVRGHVTLRGRRMSLESFYQLASGSNRTGYSTAYVIRARYVPKTPVLKPLGELRTTKEFRDALKAKALTRIDWDQTSRELRRALVLALADQERKPVHWLNSVDFAKPLKGFRRGAAPFSLRTLLISYQSEDERGRPASLLLLNELRLLGDAPAEYLPVSEPPEIVQALEAGWVQTGSFPWSLISPALQRRLVLDMAGPRSLASLAARHYQGDPVPSLRYRHPKSGQVEDFRLRGLYAHYYRKGIEAGFEGPAYLLESLWPGRFELVQGPRRKAIAPHERMAGRSPRLLLHAAGLLILTDDPVARMIGGLSLLLSLLGASPGIDVRAVLRAA